MAKNTGSSKKKIRRTEPHMIVRDLPDGTREVTVDGHTWIERPATVQPLPTADDDGAKGATPAPSGLSGRDRAGSAGA